MLGLIQIPTTSSGADGKGGVYILFDIHVNGCYHGSVRYSQLLTFHRELKVTFDASSLEEFPGKHWIGSLSVDQMLVRRIGLEHYLHSVCQDRVIGTSEQLKEFLVAVQKASNDIPEPFGIVEVFLVNGKSVSVKVPTFDRSDQVLEKVCHEIQLSADLTYYFGLFLEREGREESWTVVRPLTDYECPIPSLLASNKISPHKITIRKNFWDPTLLPNLLEDRVAKNLLYIEALACVDGDHWEMTCDINKQLTKLQKKGLKKEYLELASTLVQYAFVQLDGLTLDHPDDDTKGHLRVGKIEVTSYVTTDDGRSKKVFTYPLTKMRSWKVGEKLNGRGPWLKFFFQLGPGDFIPVSVVGGQAIYLSNCLHSVVEELLRIRNKQGIRQPQPMTRAIKAFPPIIFYEAPPLEPLATRQDSSIENSIDTPSSDVDTPSSDVDTPTLSKDTESNDSNLPASDKASRVPSVSSDRHQTNSGHKAPKKKGPNIENPTFAFGTDDDL